MAKQYRIRVRGKQREVIDSDLLIHLLVLCGRQLAREAEQVAQRRQSAAEPTISSEVAPKQEPDT